jgi:hypothetical protein
MLSDSSHKYCDYVGPRLLHAEKLYGRICHILIPYKSTMPRPLNWLKHTQTIWWSSTLVLC